MNKTKTLAKGIIIVSFCFVCFLFFSSSASALEFENFIGNETINTYTVNEYTTVTGEKWIKEADLIIAPGVTLKLNEGATLSFEPGHKINVGGGFIILSTGARIMKGTIECQCVSGACCDGCNYKASGTQPTGYTDDTDGFCTGTEDPTTTSYVYTRDYYCNGTDANVHSSDTLRDTCGSCKYCVNNTLSCTNYGTSTLCGTDSRSCSINNYYWISGTQSPTTTSYCKYRSYSGTESVNINCNGSGSCSNYQTWSGCTSYADTTMATCGTCKYVGSCSSSTQTCSNYGPTDQCLAAGNWTCDTACKASKLLASYCSGGSCPAQSREYKYATSNGQVCKNGDFVSATCVDYCNRGAPYACSGQQPRDNAYGCAAGADNCSVGIGECGYGSACLGTCSSWCLNGVCGNAPNGTACADDGNSCTQDYCSVGACVHPPYCPGINTSCGCTSCTNCNSSDGWENVGSSYACCDGSYTYTCQDQQYRDYSCSGTSCTSTITSTQTLKSGGTYCSYGCSNGQCNQCSADEHCGASWICSTVPCKSWIRPICVSGACRSDYWHYDSVYGDYTYNTYRIDTGCASGCNDYNECTNDFCNANGTCGHTNKTNGTACTGGTCQNGTCCPCTSGVCCDGCNYKSSGSQPTGYTDDTNGFCTGTEGPTTTSYVYTRDYYCNGTDANVHSSDTLRDTCGSCKYCVNNTLSCTNYGTSTLCGTDSRSCSINNYYWISGTQSPTTTSYCKYRSYSGTESVNINCNGSGSCSNYQTWSGCSSYSDTTMATCGTCQAVSSCSYAGQFCTNYSSSYQCLAAGSWTCDSNCKAGRPAASYCSGGSCPAQSREYKYATSNGQVCKNGNFVSATCVDYCNRGAPYACSGQQPRDNAYGCAAGADNCSVGIGECGYGSACLGTCSSWCLNGVCGNAPNGTACTGGTCQNGVCCPCTSGDCCDGCNFRPSSYQPSGTCRKCTGSSGSSVYQTSSEDKWGQCTAGFASCASSCTMNMGTGNCSGSSASCGTYQQHCDIYTACGAGGCSSSYRCGTWDYCHSSEDAYWNNFVCGPNTGSCNYVTDKVNCPTCQHCPSGTYGSCRNYTNNTQDATSPNYCDGVCRACQGGYCSYALVGTNPNPNQCVADYPKSCASVCQKVVNSGLCGLYGVCATTTKPCDYGTSCFASYGICYSWQYCDTTDVCWLDTYYSDRTCNSSGVCNIVVNPIGCCQGSKCSSGQYCEQSTHQCTVLPSCKVRNNGGFGYSAAPNGTACQNGGTCQNGCCTCAYSERYCCYTPGGQVLDFLESSCNGCDWGTWDKGCYCSSPQCNGVSSCIWQYTPVCFCVFQNYPNPF